MSKQTVKLIYTGRCLAKGGRVAQCFKFGKRELIFVGVRVNMIGGAYEGTREGDRFQISKKPKWLGRAEGVTDEQVEIWEAEHATFLAERKEESEERKCSRDTKLAKIAEQLAPMVRGVGYIRTRALITALVDMADKAARKKR